MPITLAHEKSFDYELKTVSLQLYIQKLQQKETESRVDHLYMGKQKHINAGMRSILVDWLVDVGVHFEVMSETLHMAINYADQALSKMEIQKNQLQLVGTACMKIADIFNEKNKEYYRQENAVEYAYITADEYTPQNVIEMEKEVLTLLNFNLCAPTSIHFLKLYARLLKVDRLTELVALYIADLQLLLTNQLEFPPSLVGSVCLFEAFVAQVKPLPRLD